MKALASGLKPASYLAFLLWALVLLAFLPDSRVWVLFPVVLALGLASGRGGLGILKSPRLWILLLSMLALTPFLLGEPDVRLGRIGLSLDGLETGFWMAVRALTLMLAFSVALQPMTVAETVGLFERAGLRGLGFALGVALNLRLVLRDTVESAYHSLRLRGGLRKPLQALRLFLVTVVANALRYGDDVVKAATARAFDPNAAPSRTGAVWRWPDKAFVCGLAVLGAGLLVWG